ncbi:MAG TPA: hypothetical protein DDZ11_05730 [Lentisphaeria bacterium]|nr:hypothetical protein [Lentisphaeria bacterium]
MEYLAKSLNKRTLIFMAKTFMFFLLGIGYIACENLSLCTAENFFGQNYTTRYNQVREGR